MSSPSSSLFLQTNNPHEWLQVDFLSMKRVTGLVTQGARSVLKLMMVTEFTVSISNNGHSWTSVKELGTDSEKVWLYLCVLASTL